MITMMLSSTAINTVHKHKAYITYVMNFDLDIKDKTFTQHIMFMH